MKLTLAKIFRLKTSGTLLFKNISKKELSVFAGFVFTFSILSVNAQQPTQQNIPKPSVEELNRRSIEDANRQIILQQQRAQEGFNRERELEVKRSVILLSLGKGRRDARELYRKTSKKELETLAVNQEDTKRYESFLKQNKSGLIRLVPDLGCSENQYIIVATEDCLKYTMPGGGSSYSFRVRDYRIPGLADISFTSDSFQVAGKMLHGILTGVGDVPLEKITLQSSGVRYLTDFQPVTQFEDIALVNKQLSAEIVKDGFVYGRELKTVGNMTYILRSVAYNGEVYRSVNGALFNELSFDKRRDVIIAFKVINLKPGKSVTILWKELENKDSPRIKRKIEDKKPI